MKLNLTKNESNTLFRIMSSELHYCINEWDPDAGHCPSKKRIKESQYAESIMDKWQNTQLAIAGTTFIDLDKISACIINLSDKEVTYSLDLLDKSIRECQKTLAECPSPNSGIATTINRIITDATHICTKLNPINP